MFSFIAAVIQKTGVLGVGLLMLLENLVPAEGRRGAERKYQASSREVAQLMQLFSGVIEAVDQAQAEGGDAIDRIDAQVGWAKLLDAKPKVDALAALAAEDPLVSAADRYGALRRFAPTFFEHGGSKPGPAVRRC